MLQAASVSILKLPTPALLGTACSLAIFEVPPQGNISTMFFLSSVFLILFVFACVLSCLYCRPGSFQILALNMVAWLVV